LTFPEHPLAVALLTPPALAYRAAVAWRNRRYDRPGAAVHPGIPVISVGNLTVGGTGKTPLTAWIASHLLEDGRRPAIVSRGYGGSSGRGPCVVSRGAGPLVPAGVAGDEPVLLARRLPGVLVVVGSDRLAGARAAREAGADVLVLDDGFQHRRLARDLDLVLLDSHDPFGAFRLLPSGPLREPVASLKRADAVILTRSRPGEPLPFLERVIRRHAGDVPLLRAGHRATGFVDAAGSAQPPPGRAVAFCGIGSPDTFLVDLLSEGVEVLEERRFPDHHRFRPAELAEIAALARRHGAVPVTTEKDLVRLPGPVPLPDVLALRIEAVPHEPARLRALLEGALEKRA
jgi:tetraacyldisaccharide 4'-kinase